MRKESCADSRAFLRRSGIISDRLVWGELRCRQTTTVGVVVRGLLQEESDFEAAEFCFVPTCSILLYQHQRFSKGGESFFDLSV